MRLSMTETETVAIFSCGVRARIERALQPLRYVRESMSLSQTAYITLHLVMLATLLSERRLNFICILIELDSPLAC